MNQYAELNDTTGPSPLSTLDENEEENLTIEYADKADCDKEQSKARQQQ
jgi:hypothetical protein